MDSVLFGLKRAHQSSLRFGREATEKFGLTPARFDLLFTIKQHRMCDGTFEQALLPRVLGVSRPVVSRMLRSLERLGLVHRGPRRHRTRFIALTVRGLAAIRRAAKRLYFNGFARRLVARSLRHDGCENDFARREHLEASLKSVRGFFRDHASLFYYWHPDD
jgi:DNA-binding MarR family transcriptional regulator